MPEWENDLADALALLQALSAASSPLLANTQALANHLYSRWFHEIVEDDLQPYPTPGQYAAATALEPLYQPGWTLMALESGGVHARSADEAEARLALGDVAPLEPTRPLQAGVQLRVIDRATQGSNGFWHLWSAGWRAQPPPRIERLYLAITPGAELLVAQALAETAPLREVWYAKFLTGIQPAGRRDPGLLYLPPGAAERSWVHSFVAAAAPFLTPSRVRLSDAAATGVSYARDPGGGRSFGQAICEAIAAVNSVEELRSMPRFLAALRLHLAADLLPELVVTP